MRMAIHLTDEAALVSAAQLGDGDAFSVLVNQYNRNVYRLALRITGNREDAEDSLQDALLKAYCNLKRFQGQSRFYTWLVRITMNEALMRLRRRRSDRQLPLEDLHVTEDGVAPRQLEDSSSDPEKLYADVELHEALARALGSISPRLSRAILLQSVEDFTVKETAETLGLSVAAVKSRLARARRRLRQRLSTKGSSLVWRRRVECKAIPATIIPARAKLEKAPLNEN
jgi:RNA polymerase sigma-70 factor (ECF subfamily)